MKKIIKLKIKLYIHIGTEKTGSSFLQSILAQNRELLKSQKIYYPSAGNRESDMLKGRISPGNANELNNLLHSQEWTKVNKWMQKQFDLTVLNGCNALLLSNELLIKSFGINNNLKLFNELCENQGFVLQDLLLIVREPVSQALSLYKHRSKSGVIYPIEDWLHKYYTLHADFQHFYTNLSKTNIRLKQYPYKKEGDYLIKILSKKWLKISTEFSYADKSINPSLTLSELYLLGSIKKHDVILSKKFYNKIITLENSSKASDTHIKDYICNQINTFMSNYNEIWESVNNYMSEAHEPYSYERVNIIKQNISYSFSNEQLQYISELMTYSGSFKFQFIKISARIKRFLISIIPDRVTQKFIYLKSKYLQ